MGKFLLSACSAPVRSTKRTAEDAASAPTAVAGPARAAPKASDVVVLEKGPRPARAPGRLPTSAPVLVAVYLVTENAADVWPAYETTQGIRLWQVQLKHDARPSIFFDLVASFGDYLKEARAEDSSMPASLADLQAQCGVKLVLADAADPENIGFVQWRPAFYVAGEDASALENFLHLLDGWFGHKATQMARAEPFELHLHPHMGIDVTKAAEDFSYPWTTEEPAASLPMGFFEAQPVVGKRAVTFHFEAEGDAVNVLIAGNTWAFRSRLDAHGVPGAYHADGSEARTYYRVMKGLSPTADKQKVLDMLGGAVFKGLALRAVVNGAEPDADSAAGVLLAELRDIPQLHWVKA